jgi:hypothetical protein
MSYYPEMPNKEKNSLNKDQHFFPQIGRYGYEKNPQFYADLTMGQIIFLTSSYKKLEPKKSILGTCNFSGNPYFGFNF